MHTINPRVHDGGRSPDGDDRRRRRERLLFAGTGLIGLLALIFGAVRGWQSLWAPGAVALISSLIVIGARR